MKRRQSDDRYPGDYGGYDDQGYDRYDGGYDDGYDDGSGFQDDPFSEASAAVNHRVRAQQSQAKRKKKKKVRITVIVVVVLALLKNIKVNQSTSLLMVLKRWHLRLLVWVSSLVQKQLAAFLDINRGNRFASDEIVCLHTRG